MATKKTKKKTKKRTGSIGVFATVLISLVLSGLSYFVFIGSSTQFIEKEKVWYIASTDDRVALLDQLLKADFSPFHQSIFGLLARSTGYYNNVHAGRYIIHRGNSVFTIFRKLHGGKQDPVRLTIKKIRTRTQLADWIGMQLDCSSKELLDLLNNDDSLQPFGVNAESAMSLIHPNTYDIYWTTSAKGFLERMKKESDRFWNSQRRAALERIRLSTVEAVTLASIIEEETNEHFEKPLMASVYMNRIRLGMPLGADPTIKFALHDFSIRRVTLGHIAASAASPYNTYKRKGLPPGPICTPSAVSIDAVLEGKTSNYLYFCAKPDFSGAHNFAATAKQHFENARNYRKALDSLGIQ